VEATDCAIDGTVSCAKRDDGRPDFTGTAGAAALVGVGGATLAGALTGAAAAAGFLTADFSGADLAAVLGFGAGGGGAFALTAGALGLLTFTAGLLFAGAAADFLAMGALPLAAGFTGDLAADLTGVVGFLAGAADALAPLAGLGLAAGLALATTLGFAFLVLVAFNLCLLCQTQGPGWWRRARNAAYPSGLSGLVGARVYRQAQTQQLRWKTALNIFTPVTAPSPAAVCPVAGQCQ